MTALSPHLSQRCRSIRLLLLDVDGVLTDGNLIYGAEGEALKAFNVRDGLGIRLLMESGIQVGVVTGRGGPILDRRCRELGVRLIFDQIKDKQRILTQITAANSISPGQIAFVGDDLIDLPLLTRVGLPIAVADAHPEVRRTAAWTTQAAGGRGAVREVCEGLLEAQDLWTGILETYQS
ncbi:MAG: HAD-IIIA family hydrolase [Desulfobacterales bacterium]|jgi:3-deoxy-D-manno-octulosonate 8-phosphate phosphatase (KDO 8-P phosphatase)